MVYTLYTMTIFRIQCTTLTGVVWIVCTAGPRAVLVLVVRVGGARWPWGWRTGGAPEMPWSEECFWMRTELTGPWVPTRPERQQSQSWVTIPTECSNSFKAWFKRVGSERIVLCVCMFINLKRTKHEQSSVLLFQLFTISTFSLQKNTNALFSDSSLLFTVSVGRVPAPPFCPWMSDRQTALTVTVFPPSWLGLSAGGLCLEAAWPNCCRCVTAGPDVVTVGRGGWWRGMSSASTTESSTALQHNRRFHEGVMLLQLPESSSFLPCFYLNFVIPARFR